MSGPLEAGEIAPDFSLSDAQRGADAKPVALAQLLDQGPVVLIFNMGLHCPACAGELWAFGARIEDFRAAGIQVAAVSDEDPADIREDLKSLPGVPFPLLYDPGDATARAYGLVGANGVEERTFYIDQTGRVRDAYRPDQPGGGIPRLLALKGHPGAQLEPSKEATRNRQ
jgi:peroxiredoxin